MRWPKISRTQLQSMRRDTAVVPDHATYLASKITFLLDAMLGVINIEQNNIIKIFSVAAVVFMPPTLIASIYGMNFDIMPELDWTWLSARVCSMIVLGGILPYPLLQMEEVALKRVVGSRRYPVCSRP